MDAINTRYGTRAVTTADLADSDDERDDGRE